MTVPRSDAEIPAVPDPRSCLNNGFGLHVPHGTIAEQAASRRMLTPTVAQLFVLVEVMKPRYRAFVLSTRSRVRVRANCVRALHPRLPPVRDFIERTFGDALAPSGLAPAHMIESNILHPRFGTGRIAPDLVAEQRGFDTAR